MKKGTKLKTALFLLAAATNMSYASESCVPPKKGQTPLKVLECLQKGLDTLTAKTEKQQKRLQEQVLQLKAENQAQQDEIQALKLQLVAQKKELDERLTLMSISRKKNVFTFVDAKGTKHTLDLGDGKKPLENEWIAYRPGNNKKKEDAILYFNLNGSPSIACTLLHDEDDSLRSGFYFATDGGNDFKSIWGKGGINTFALSREGVASYVIGVWASYNILCVK